MSLTQQAPSLRSAERAEVDLQAFRSRLEEQRRFRVEQLKDLAAEARGSTDFERLDVARMLAIGARAALRDIEHALVRMEQGTYGVCEDCTKPIQLERLDVVPMSRYCTPCQRRASATAPGLVR